MKRLLASLVVIAGLIAPLAAEDLVDLGWVSGWNVMADPQMGGGCLIQTVYDDLSVVRMGYDGTTEGDILSSSTGTGGASRKAPPYTYTIRFELNGNSFDAVATGLY